MSIPKFEDIKISTITMTILTNLSIDLEKLFEFLQPIQNINIPKSLKNKTDIEKYIISQNYPVGSLLTIEYKGKVKGFKILKRKQWSNKENTNKKPKFFRNGISAVMVLSNKLLNFKIPSQGKIQITGCKCKSQAIECVKHIWKTIENSKTFSLLEKDNFYAIFKTVMTNIDFDLGFEIDREKLDRYINRNTNYHSLLETSYGYTGVNIKKSFEHQNIELTYIENIENDEWKYSTIFYNDYLNKLSDKQRKKELTKKRNNTFLVFYSGSAIMSGMILSHMKEDFYNFINIISSARKQIEERIIE